MQSVRMDLEMRDTQTPRLQQPNALRSARRPYSARQIRNPITVKLSEFLSFVLLNTRVQRYSDNKLIVNTCVLVNGGINSTARKMATANVYYCELPETATNRY